MKLKFKLKDMFPKTPQDLIRSLPLEIKTLLFNQWKAKQNEKWHPEGNTLKHIIYVLRRAYKKHPENVNIILAALFHDLGKKDTYQINPKTGKPTAHGHEKISAEYVLNFRDWIESFDGGDADVVYYIVKNHMAIKPDVWNVMKQSKKDKITGDINYHQLDKFRHLDKGGINESITEKDIPRQFSDNIRIENDLGRAHIVHQNRGLKHALIALGYDDLNEIEYNFQREEVFKYAKKIPNELVLIHWSSKQKNNGFGRTVIQKLFDLGQEYNLNKFRIFNPSYDARKILNHYEKTGNLKRVEASKSGLSDDPFYTEFLFLKKP